MSGLPVNLLLANAMKDCAAEASRNNSYHLARTYRKAFKSLSLYPLPIKTGRQARDLNGIGEFLEKQIDRWLMNPAELYDFPSNQSAMRKIAAQSPRRSPKRKNVAATTSSADPLAPKRLAVESEEVAVRVPAVASGKSYTPRIRSGAWALLIALLKIDKRTGKPEATKEELLVEARALSDEKDGPFPWTAMSTLVSKGIVARSSHPIKYSLTDDGRAVAQRLEPLNLPPSPHHRSRSPRGPEAEEPRPTKAARSDEINAREMGYWFVTSSGKVISKKEHAEVRVENEELWVRIDFSGRMPAGARAEQRGNDTLTWMLDAIAPATVTVPHHSSISVPAPPSIASSVSAKPAAAASVSLSPKLKSKEKAKRTKNGDARIVALLDNREVKDKKDRAHIAEQLLKKGIDCEVRALELGDVLWVVRRPNKPDLVLDWILERKRVSDLESSIMDKRYTEQKFRLTRSGVAHIIYLVEGQLEKVRSLDPAAVQSALASTQLEDCYIVMHTLSLATTIERIASITRMIEEEHAQTNWDEEERKGRRTVQQFLSNASKSKNLSVRDLFAMQLLSIAGVSPPKAAAITAMWPTPMYLLEAYTESSKPELLLQDLEWQKGKRIGPALSKKVWELFKIDA